MISGNDLPPRGEPMGGYKEYSDCTGCSSVLCGRPDCKNCGHSFHHWCHGTFPQLIASILFVADGKPLHPKIQELVDHFDPKLNACAYRDTHERIACFIAELKEQPK